MLPKQRSANSTPLLYSGCAGHTLASDVHSASTDRALPCNTVPVDGSRALAPTRPRPQARHLHHSRKMGGGRT